MGGKGSGRPACSRDAQTEQATGKLAPYFRAARDLAGIGLVEAGRRAGMGASTIQQYEAGIREPKLNFAARLAAVYGVSLYYLAGLPAPSAPKEETPCT